MKRCIFVPYLLWHLFILLPPRTCCGMFGSGDVTTCFNNDLQACHDRVSNRDLQHARRTRLALSLWRSFCDYIFNIQKKGFQKVQVVGYILDDIWWFHAYLDDYTNGQSIVVIVKYKTHPILKLSFCGYILKIHKKVFKRYK